MREVVIKIDTPDKITEFCKLCSKCSGDVNIYSDRHVVSGKSLFGLYSLDLTHPLRAEFNGDIPDDVKEDMKKFIVY